MQCRCRRCDARKTLRKRLAEYVRVPACPRCGARDWREDHYRARKERGRAAPLCRPDHTGCDGYHHVHRRGSGWCMHNASISGEDREERWQSGYRSKPR